MMLKKEKSLTITISIIILAALLFVIFTLNQLSTSSTSSNIKSQKGVLELSNWDFNKNGYTSLGGQWEFYWQQLLTPENFDKRLTNPSYIEMPKEWNKYNKNYSSSGYATYSLTINLNDKYKHAHLGMSVPSMLSSYKLWVNGELFSTNGIVGTSSLSEYSNSMPITNYFMNKSSKIHLILQVSNYNFRDGGTWDKIYLGTQPQIISKRESSIALELFYFGVFLIMGLYHLWLYAFITVHTPKLYFGALCITLALRTLIIGNKYLLTLYNGLSYSFALKLEYLTFYVGVYFLISYVYITFKDYFSDIVKKFCDLFCCFIIIVTFTSPPLLASKFLTVFQIFSLLIITYTTFVILKSYYCEKKSGLIIPIVCLFPAVIIAISILRYLGFNNATDYSLPGFFLLILLNSFVLAMNESKTYEKIENLSKENERYLLAEKLTKVTFLLNSTLNLQEVLDKLLENLKELVPYDSASFFMKENSNFNVMAANGFENMEQIYKLSINKEDDELFKELYLNKSLLLVSNVKEDPRFSKFIDGLNVESWMGIPIMFKNEIVGILTLDSSHKNFYTKYHCDIALYFAYHAGMAIKNAKLHGETKKLASVDPLTNLYNRRSFFELANINFDKAKALSQTISGIMMDIDDFKKINDTLGHHTGDLVLKRLSKLCTDTLCKNHILGRFGGEEFIVLLPGTSFEEAELIAENLRSVIENNPIIIRKSDLIPITVSIGVISITPAIHDLEMLFKQADKAMYKAKALGKNQVVSVNLE